jgi:hypothetical protein
MDILNAIQEMGPVQIIAGMLILPWVCAAFMQSFGLVTRNRHDDNFADRAAAAVRWNELAPDPVTPKKHEVLVYRARPAARVRAISQAMENEAA